MHQKFELDLDTAQGTNSKELYNTLTSALTATALTVKELPLTSTVTIRRAVVMSVGKPKSDEKAHTTFCWVKISPSSTEQPILFKLQDNHPLYGKVHSGSLVSAEFTYISRDKSISFASAPTKLEVIGEEDIALTHQFPLSTITFHDDFIDLSQWYGARQPLVLDSGFKVMGWRGNLLQVPTMAKSQGVRRIHAIIDQNLWHTFQPDFDLSYTHNKIKEKLPVNEQQSSFIEVSGHFGVFYNLDDTVTLYPKETLTIVRHNMLSMQRAVADSQLALRWKQVRERLREILSTRHVISLEEASKVFEQFRWSTNDIEGTLKSLTWSKSYDEDYFAFIKSLAGNNPTYFTEDGYLFAVSWRGKDFTVWETPEVNKATYVMRGSPQECVAKLGDFKRSEIRASTFDAQMSFVIGWVNHVLGYFDNWTDRIKEMLDGVNL